jgi:hydroxymethylbilane synthase
MSKTIRVGTRESALAMAQTKLVIAGIQKKFPGLEFELVGMTTTGDLVLEKTLDPIGGKGLFVKEIELALLRGTIDIAVHSMKDLPVQIAEGLVIAAISGREDPRDALITANGLNLEELPSGAVIGTSSTRRRAQFSQKRPDLRFAVLRGNVLTRIDKLMERQFDAIVIAAAGLKRLGLENKVVQYFETDDIIPAACQGILAIQTRKGEETGYLLESVHCGETALCAQAERAYMIKLNGGCSTPMAAHAVISGETMIVYGMLADGDCEKVYRASVTGNKVEADFLGKKLADRILAQTGGTWNGN